jgi:hypothetical protein
MRITRLVELSLYFKVQDALSMHREKEKPKSADFKTYNLKYSNIQTQYPVVVYLNNVELLEDKYKVDYTNGIIKLDLQATSSDTVEVSYRFCPVNLYDESKNPLSDEFRYPAVAIYEHKRKDVPYELGSNKKEKNPTWFLDVWTNKGGERNDLTDMIMEMFEEGVIPIIDYNIMFPMDENGEKNESFDPESQIIGYMYCDSINYTKGGSLDIGEKPTFLSEIYTDLIINT